MEQESVTKSKLTLLEQYRDFVGLYYATLEMYSSYGERVDPRNVAIDAMRELRDCEPYKELVQTKFMQPKDAPHPGFTLDSIVRKVMKISEGVAAEREKKRVTHAESIPA